MQEEINKEKKHLEELVGFALDTAKKLGAEESKVRVNKFTGLSVSCRKQELENISYSQDRSLFITVYCGCKKGETSTNDLSHEAIEESIRAAISIAQHTAEDLCLSLPNRELLATDTIDFDICHPCDTDPDEALESCKFLEKMALSADSRIVNSLGAKNGNYTSISVFGNSHDFIRSDARTYFTKSIHVIGAKDEKMEHGYSYSVNTSKNKLWDNSKLITEAVDECVAALGPKKPLTGNYPVIFKAQEAEKLYSCLFMAISGFPQYYKTSFLLDCKGKQVLPEWINIDEKPFIVGSQYSRYMDGDGVKTSDYVVIDKGIVTDYLLSDYSAKKLNMITNGHAGGLSNVFVRDNRGVTNSYDDLVRKMDRGVIVTSTMGQGVNSMTGDYSLGAQGFWVENGKIQYPISEFTVASNLKDMYKNIVAIADDTDERSSILTGSILIDEMKIAGL